MRRTITRLAVAAAGLCLAVHVGAQEEPRPSPAAGAETTQQSQPGPTAPGERSAPRLEEIVVEAQKPLSAASSDEIRARDFELRPHTNLIQTLNNIPGLVVAQHQGGNKAPQWLIRGFDADHGTDIDVMVDEMPVNLVSHAHGQGYADINFVIPETIDRYQIFKGPYFPQFGDFANAATLDLVTKDRFDENFLLAEGGSFDTQRYVAGLSPKLGDLDTLFAFQAASTNGPFDNPENLSSYKGFAKLTARPTVDSKLSLSGGGYQADWDGSGQIPLREVSAGRLDRFGSIDPTEGGKTDRQNLDLHYQYTPTAQDTWSFQTYGSRYKLRLWSDFTFFADTGLRFVLAPDGSIVDTRGEGSPLPGARYIPGDGIEQNDSRYLYGARGRYTRSWFLLEHAMETQVGVETRNDDVNLGLYRQVRRQRFFTANKLRIEERSFSGYLAQQVFFTDWLRLEAGLRGDVFLFHARDRLPKRSLASGSDPNFDAVPIAGMTTASIISPKANLVATVLPETDLYLNFGEGFHSNDARNAILGRDSDFAPLTKSLGYEAGVRTRQLDRLDAAAAIWLLDLDSELVFSGDAGSQETPAGASRRWGIDFETRYQFTRWLFGDYDLSFADARFANGDGVPLAPTLLMNGGLTVELPSGFSVALRGRFLDDRPAIEDRSLVARGYFLLDLIGRYRWRNVEASLQLLNLTDTDWREAQFADTSCVRRDIARGAVGCSARPGEQAPRLRPGESPPPDPRPDIHFTPGIPFGAIAGLKVYF